MNKHDPEDTPDDTPSIPVAEGRKEDMFWTLDRALRKQDSSEEPIQVSPELPEPASTPRDQLASEVNTLARRIVRGDKALKVLKEVHEADRFAGWLPQHLRDLMAEALED